MKPAARKDRRNYVLQWQDNHRVVVAPEEIAQSPADFSPQLTQG